MPPSRRIPPSVIGHECKEIEQPALMARQARRRHPLKPLSKSPRRVRRRHPPRKHHHPGEEEILDVANAGVGPKRLLDQAAGIILLSP